MKNYLQLGSYYYLFLLLLLFTISFHYPIGSAGDGQEEEQQIQEQLYVKSKTPIIETVKKMFSFPTSFPQTSANYWSRFESLIKQGKAYFSPPTLDFRDSQEAHARAEGGAAPGEKVKEAVLKSLDKSKAALEESAKSAAKLAGEAVQKTAKKMKRTFSFEDRDPGHDADEL
ncbi:hypothetical protein MTR67_028324 [Solanum verrucosum]|uniref:Transmembrane protein n=1 Tax=Solanum verrucosum TaxID=315347 RepID=A0AAF0RB63_SOLVR|nr:uncharacterized protein LOC125828400 [Solanum verrucosum]WMV34939.1 hypothetical protein MTR67_028324 [Solanum verrucosum]